MGLFTSDLLSTANSVPKHINGITCDARNCIYHDGDNFCTANRVTIGSTAATRSSETRCATFEARGEITRKY